MSNDLEKRAIEIAGDLFYDIEHDAPMFDGRVSSREIQKWKDRSKVEIAKRLVDLSLPAPGTIRTEDGVDRKVLGTLKLTADDCVCGEPDPEGSDYSLWHPMGAEYRTVIICAQWPFGHEYDPSCSFDEVYSTREAALAASRGKEMEHGQ